MATFPTGIMPWTDKVDNVDDVMAADVNTLAAEVIAVEDDLVNGNIVRDDNLATTTVAFTESATLADIASGDTIAVIFGKLKKWYTDFANRVKAVLFGGTTVTEIADAEFIAVPVSATSLKKITYAAFKTLLGTLYAAADHTQALNKGGTGATTAEAARTALSVQQCLFANTTLYVATTGNDTTGTGLIGAPFATPQKAVDSLPKNLNGFTPTISIAAGTYTGDLIVKDFIAGRVLVAGASATTTILTGTVFANNCSLGIGLIKYRGIQALWYGSLSINDTTIIDCIDKSTDAIRIESGCKGVIEYGASVTANNCNRVVYCFCSDFKSYATIAGTNNNVGIYSIASVVVIATPSLSATTAESTLAGGQIFKS